MLLPVSLSLFFFFLFVFPPLKLFFSGLHFFSWPLMSLYLWLSIARLCHIFSHPVLMLFMLFLCFLSPLLPHQARVSSQYNFLFLSEILHFAQGNYFLLLSVQQLWLYLSKQTVRQVIWNHLVRWIIVFTAKASGSKAADRSQAQTEKADKPWDWGFCNSVYACGQGLHWRYCITGLPCLLMGRWQYFKMQQVI